MSTDDPIRSLEGSLDRVFARPARMGTFGMWLFLAALAMLFAASMIAYIAIRTGPQGATRGAIHLPHALWLSTALILLSSVTMHRAVHAIRLERHRPFRIYLVTTLALAAGFVAVQTPALISLLKQHQAVEGQKTPLYGLIFFLVLLHALHVLGGIIGLIRVNLGAAHHRYDHEHCYGVRHIAMYWHFLDGVWLVMFLILHLTA
ncbi:MAG: cytochrome c oxidase subunit 3 [Bacillota bacterium]